MAEADAAALKRTPLYEAHLRLGARMVPFAGYEMPVQYSHGIIKEHLHTRAAAGLFDVSHMGQIVLRARSGLGSDAALALEALVPGDMSGIAPGRQRYTLFTNEAGGVRDDLMVNNQGDRLRLVVNAACKDADLAHLRAHLAGSCQAELIASHALLALQGPKAEAVLSALSPDVRAMRFMDVRELRILGADCVVSRSGYTGEDGFEIGVAADAAVSLWDALLREPAVAPIGLGARDTLRLEAGLCLYGSDLTPDTTPVEAALEWTIAPARRPGGVRAGRFPGADVILRQLIGGAPRRRVGLRPYGRSLVRGGTTLFLAEHDTQAAGIVTSGGFGVSLDAPIAMGYVTRSAAEPGRRLFAEVRGKRVELLVCAVPFVASHYKR